MMLHYQHLSDVEQTFNLFEFCVLVDLRIRQRIGPKMDGAVIDEDMNIHHINAFVLDLCIENVASFADILNFFFNQ